MSAGPTVGPLAPPKRERAPSRATTTTRPSSESVSAISTEPPGPAATGPAAQASRDLAGSVAAPGKATLKPVTCPGAGTLKAGGAGVGGGGGVLDWQAASSAPAASVATTALRPRTRVTSSAGAATG